MDHSRYRFCTDFVHGSNHFFLYDIISEKEVRSYTDGNMICICFIFDMSFEDLILTLC